MSLEQSAKGFKAIEINTFICLPDMQILTASEQESLEMCRNKMQL